MGIASNSSITSLNKYGSFTLFPTLTEFSVNPYFHCYIGGAITHLRKEYSNKKKQKQEIEALLTHMYMIYINSI